MAGLTGIKKHVAFFYDTSGNYVDSKVFKYSFQQGLKIKTFDYNQGTYNIVPSCSRAYRSGFFTDSYFSNYNIGNPDPINQGVGSLFHPVMSPRTYYDVFHSNLINDLNKVRRGGLLSLLSPQVLIIGILIIGAIIYFASGGSITSPSSTP